MVGPYLTRGALAKAIMIGESTVDDMVRRGIIPPPCRLTSGCVRWRWETVDQALASLQGGEESAAANEVQSGVQRAIQAAKERRRGRAA